MGIRHLAHVLTVPPTKACLLCATPAGMDLYILVHARRLLPSAVPWISEDRLLGCCLQGQGHNKGLHNQKNINVSSLFMLSKGTLGLPGPQTSVSVDSVLLVILNS